MDFAATEEQLEFKRHCRAFARDVIRPAAPRHDADESIPWEVIKAARAHNLEGLEVMRSFGTDPDGQLSIIYAEEMHWGCGGIALAMSATTLAAAGIIAAGTPEQIERWIPECLGTGDEIKIGAYAVTESQAGSDVKSLRTTAKLDDDEWVLNGTKVFISNGGVADLHVVITTVDPDLGHRGQASFVIGRDTPGIRQGKKESKLGIRASQTAEVVLEDCRIPAENLLGGLETLERKLERARSGQSSGRASGALATFEMTRPSVGASALGIAQAAYEWTLGYFLDEEIPAGAIDEALDELFSTAGQPHLQRQRIQQVLGDVATEIEAARLLVQRAAWMARNGVPMTGGQGSMSKLKAGDVTMWATTQLMDLVGPAAASSPLEKWFRDAKIYQLFEGTAQIQRLVISRMQADVYREQLLEGAETAAAALQAADATGNGAATGAGRDRAGETGAGTNGSPVGERERAAA